MDPSSLSLTCSNAYACMEAENIMGISSSSCMSYLRVMWNSQEPTPTTNRLRWVRVYLSRKIEINQSIA